MTEADLKEIETRYRAWQQKDVRRVDLEVCMEDVTALIKALRAAWAEAERKPAAAPGVEER